MQEKNVQQLKIKPKPEPDLTWHKPPRCRRGEELMKNMAVAASLVLCAIVLRSGALPQAHQATDAVLAAVTGDTLLDDSLGKLSFVSSLFPEATLVFGQQQSPSLTLPVSGGAVIHAWSEEEPYTSWQGGDTVLSCLSGEVIGIYHGEDEELLVQVLGTDDVSCLHGNLKEVFVQVGDAVKSGDRLGSVLPGKNSILEVRKDGWSIDPMTLLPQMQ